MDVLRSRLRAGQPIWLKGTEPAPAYPSLSGTHEADVVIVGAGFTGALIAEALTAAGVAVVVLERGLVAGGSTAASAALVLHEPDAGFVRLEQRYGTRTSRRVWTVCLEAVRALLGLLQRLNVSCALQRRDTIYYATTDEAARRLHGEWRRRARAGFDGAWLGAAQLRDVTGIAAAGAIRTYDNAQLDPYRATVGILRAAALAGARVFERTRVTRIDPASDHVRVRTPDGVVHARRVVIATGYATPAFRPLAGHFRMYRTYVLATAPIDRSRRGAPGLSDVLLWDTDRPYHYARWTAEHRLVVGGADRAIRPGARRDLQFAAATSDLREYFARALPGFGRTPIEFAWEGVFAQTPDSLPYIGPHRRYPGHWFALGYGGNGMTFGAIAARLLVERWNGVTSPDHGLFGFDRLGASRRRGSRG